MGVLSLNLFGRDEEKIPFLCRELSSDRSVHSLITTLADY
jgi:hypothetical protein